MLFKDVYQWLVVSEDAESVSKEILAKNWSHQTLLSALPYPAENFFFQLGREIWMAMGFFKPSSMRWDSMAPMPYGDPSQASSNSFWLL